MAVPNLSPGYLGQVKGIRAQREENEKQRSFEADQASKNFLRRLGGDVLGTALGIGADLAGTAFRDSLTKNERAAAAGTFYPDDDAMGESGAAIRQIAESRAATELRPQASFGEAAETGYGRRGIETAAPPLGGVKAQVLKPPAVTPPAPARPPSNPMLTPGLEAQFSRVTSAPVVPSPIAPRGMESEAPRRPMAAPPSPMAQRPAPMPPRETREAPGGYQPPRMMPSTTAAIARESGYREAIPSLPTDVRGLAQQAQDVRDKRALDLELLRKQLLWDEEQAKANVASLQARGASATAIAQAKQQEAIARQNAQAALEAKYYAEAAAAGRPVVGRGGRVIWQPGQVATPRGSTEQGFGADFGPPTLRAQAGAVGGRGGAGGAARGGEEPTGDVLTIVRQNRNKKGEPVGPSQPLRVQESPSLWRAVASSPVDYGMDAAQSATYREAYRQYNAALPVARKGDPQAAAVMAQAQGAMRSALVAAQSQYAPAVAGTREGFGTSQRDEEIARVRDEQAAIRRQVEDMNRARGQAKIAGSAISDTAALALPAEVTLDEVADVVAQDAGVVPADKGRFQSTQSDGELERAEYEAALRGAPMPAGLDAASADLYNQVKQRAQDAKTRILSQKEALREKRLRAIVTELSADTDDPVGYLESLGVVVPQSLKPAPLPAGNRPVAPRPAAPAPRAAPARPAAPSMPRFNSLDQAAEWVAKQPISPAEKSALLERIEDTQGLQ